MRLNIAFRTILLTQLAVALMACAAATSNAPAPKPLAAPKQNLIPPPWPPQRPALPAAAGAGGLLPPLVPPPAQPLPPGVQTYWLTHAAAVGAIVMPAASIPPTGNLLLGASDQEIHVAVGGSLGIYRTSRPTAGGERVWNVLSQDGLDSLTRYVEEAPPIPGAPIGIKFVWNPIQAGSFTVVMQERFVPFGSTWEESPTIIRTQTVTVIAP